MSKLKEKYIQFCCDFYNEHAPEDKLWFGRMFDQCQEDYEQQNRCMYRWQFPLMILKDQEAQIDELKHQKSLQELAINQISQANQEWQRINSDLQKRVDELEDNVNNALSFYNYAKSDVNIGMIKMKQLLRGEE